jgi:hypothetical protein
MESVGIASTSRDVRWPDPIARLRSTLLSVSIRLADVTIGTIGLLGAAGSGDRTLVWGTVTSVGTLRVMTCMPYPRHAPG